jgi:hypothetical protein
MILPGDKEWNEPEAVTNGFNAFLKWWDQTDVEILEVERLIYSEQYFYAGKTDFLGCRKAKLLIGDFKTGSGFYEDQPYQATGYAIAIEEETGQKIEDGLIVHLDKKTGKFTEYNFPITDELRGAWKAAVIHYKNLKLVRAMVKELKNGQR